MKWIVIIAVLLLGSCTEKIAPTKSSIFGVVKDAETAQPLAGCNVMLVPSGRSTTTGADGTFHFDDIFPEQYSVEVNKDGYYNNKKSIVVLAGERSNVDILITRFDPNNRLATLGAITVTDITHNSVRLESEVMDQGSSSVSERGFIYSEIPNPTLSNGIRKSILGGTGLFSASFTGLKEQTTYYVVSYASNSRGTAYSNEQYSFTTLKQDEIQLPRNIIFVSTVGNDSNDGSSWSKAKKTIGAAIASAAEDRQIWVAAGAYKETLVPKDGIPIYGGFKGTETSIDSRTEKTIIPNISCISYTKPTIIDGFEITVDGYASMGIRLRDHAVLRNCLIHNINYSYSEIISINPCELNGAQMIDCIIENNKRKPVIMVDRNAELSMINCVFRGNTSGIESSGTLSMYGCVITNNGYGVSIEYNGEVAKFVNCTIANNANYGLSAEIQTAAYNCLIWNNAIIESKSFNGIVTRYSCIEVATMDNSVVRLKQPSSARGQDAKDWKTADWSLSAGSNCINAGVNLYFPTADILTDIAKQTRVLGSSIDIGAYEY